MSKAQSTFTDALLMGPKLLTASLEQASLLMRDASNLFASGLPSLTSRRSSSCCEVPETECPPRCVCEIRWEAAAGERLRAVVRVTNTSRDDRNFQFWAKGFQVGNKTVPLTVSPAAERLKAGGSTSVVAEFTPTHDFQAGQTYTAELLIEGAYEQCVCFQFTPVAEVVARCEVEQGDPPIRLRAHHWYDHFRCAEPCVQPGESFSTPGLEALKRQIKE